MKYFILLGVIIVASVWFMPAWLGLLIIFGIPLVKWVFRSIFKHNEVIS